MLKAIAQEGWRYHLVVATAGLALAALATGAVDSDPIVGFFAPFMAAGAAVTAVAAIGWHLAWRRGVGIWLIVCGALFYAVAVLGFMPQPALVGQALLGLGAVSLAKRTAVT